MANCLDLTDRVAVVIGGTTGLGRAIAVGLSEHGADVVPTGRRMKNVEDACAQIATAGRRTLAHTTDVTSHPSLDELRDAVLAKFGWVDILVNSAGHNIASLASFLAFHEVAAYCAVLCASDGASFITGQCMVVDGGNLASGVNS